MIDKNTLEIQPESVAEHFFLMRFKGAHIQVEPPPQYGFNADAFKLVIPEVDKDNVV